jgi:sortase A
MRATWHARSSSRSVGLLRWVARLFVTGGLAALLWCVFVLTDVDNAQRSARETLGTTSRSTESPSTSTPPSVSSSAPSRRLLRGTPLAELSIPRLGVSAVVLHGSDAHTLQLGLGHIENTAVPGESGNVAIAGHRDSFFRPLRNVQVGDDILLETPDERIHYRVSSFRVVNSYEVSVIGPTRDATLTLITCYPFWFIGSAPDRFVVRAMRVGHPEAVASLSAVSAASRSGRSNPEPVVDRAPIGSASESRAFTAPAMNDDDSRVQEAVDHFRLTYNGRLTRHDDGGPDGQMTFRFCDVAVTGKVATATCHAESRSPDSPMGPVWTFRLGRISGEWTITSVGMR